MWRLILALLLLTVTTNLASDRMKPDEVRIECHGKLRHGVVAIGGETTGTTVTFDRMVWELRLPNEALRKFAADHNKQPIVVTGVVRHVAGTERKARWIIDVEKLTEGTQKDGATVTAAGVLHEVAAGNATHLEIETGGTRWQLDLTAQKDMPERARALAGKPIIVNGRVERSPGNEPAPRMIIQVARLDEARS